MARRCRRLAPLTGAVDQVLSAEDLPATRPAGLRLVTVTTTWWRIDAAAPADWEWRSYDTQHGRFDPPGGRVRYAATTERGAFRERFAEVRRRIRPADGTAHVVTLTGTVRVLDLCSERTLDLLALDGEISTGRSPRVFHAAAMLAARLPDWYGEKIHGVRYASRTTPETSQNLAFYATAPLAVTDLGPLSSREAMLFNLIADDGFRVDLPGWW